MRRVRELAFAAVWGHTLLLSRNDEKFRGNSLKAMESSRAHAYAMRDQ